MSKISQWRRCRSAGLGTRALQRGSLLVNAALALVVIVVALGGTELGIHFAQKRELQKIADLAAMDGARRLASNPTECAAAAAAAAGSGQENSSDLTPGLSISTLCGTWSAPPVGSEGEQTGFSEVLAADSPRSAVRVIAEAERISVVGVLRSSVSLKADAVARQGQPIAAFSVGSRLAGLKNSTLGNLLTSIGLDISDSTLIDYNGLAQLKVTPRGLLQALGIPVSADIGVGELNELLAGRSIELGQLLNAAVSAANQSSLLGANVGLVNAIEAALGISELMVQLGTDASTNAVRGLFAQIVAPGATSTSALDVEVNALDLVFASIGVATQKRTLAINGLNVANLVKARVGLVEPPSIAIGGVGATAYTAQVRTFVEVSTSDVPLLGSLVHVKLPIMLDAVTGRGTLVEMCTDALRTADGVDRARIQVDAPVLKVCIGRPGGNPAIEDEIFATAASCETDLRNEKLLGVSLLGADLVELNTKLHIDALPMQGDAVLAPEQTATVGNNPLALGTTIKNITDALLAALLVSSLDQAPALSATERERVAKELWGAPPCNSASCRRDRLAAVNQSIESASNGLSGFLGGLSGDVLSILDGLLSLNVGGILSGIGQLVGGLLNSVGDLLGSIISGLFGNSCTGGGLFGAQGSDTGCIEKIAESLEGNSGSGSSATPNAVIALVGFLMQLLQPILDVLGNLVLRPVLEDVLGLQLGQVDVHLNSLDCHADPVLVQ